VTEDGERLEGTDAVFAYLATLRQGGAEREHRTQYRAHREDRSRETTANVLAEKAPLGGVKPAESAPRARR
jgi:hypothetical protein